MTKKERQEIFKRMKNEIEKENQELDYFLDNSYPNLSFEEKCKVWSKYFFQSLRWNGESTDDEVAIFSKENYTIWKKREARIDELLDLLIPKFSDYLGGGLEQKINDKLDREVKKK